MKDPMLLAFMIAGLILVCLFYGSCLLLLGKYAGVLYVLVAMLALGVITNIGPPNTGT